MSFPVGRIGGVPLILHLSHLLPLTVLAYVFYELAAALTPNPGLVVGAALAITVISLLAHEAGHGMVAARFGQPLERYGLSVLGAYTRPAGPYPHLKAAGWSLAAGPAVSLVLAVALMAGTAAVRVWGGPVQLEAILLLSAAMNLLLGLVNLVPIRPLDGGRLLEVLLLSWLKAPSAVSRVAAWVSSAFAIGVIAGGLAPATSGGQPSVLLALLGTGLLILNIGGQVVGAGVSIEVTGIGPRARADSSTPI